MSKPIDKLIESFKENPNSVEESLGILIKEHLKCTTLELELVNEIQKVQDQFLNNLTQLKGEFTKNKGAIEALEKVIELYTLNKVDSTLINN